MPWSSHRRPSRDTTCTTRARMAGTWEWVRRIEYRCAAISGCGREESFGYGDGDNIELGTGLACSSRPSATTWPEATMRPSSTATRPLYRNRLRTSCYGVWIQTALIRAESRPVGTIPGFQAVHLHFGRLRRPGPSRLCQAESRQTIRGCRPEHRAGHSQAPGHAGNGSDQGNVEATRPDRLRLA